MDKKLHNISNAFGASLSFGFEKEAKDYSLSKEDEVIKKYAGINIYQPTADNIETYVRKYVMNELAFFPRTLNVAIQLNPQEMDTNNPEYVSDATGMVAIKFLGKMLELPFMITDGELIPFDIVQIEGQRAPYSRENMKKILTGLENLHVKQQKIDTDDPYVGLGDRMNPTSVTGFLGSVLQIREQAVSGQGGMNGNYIYASEVIEEMLEKVAEMKELTPDDIKTLENEMGKLAAEEVKAEMEKIAEEAAKPDDKEQLKLFEKAKNTKWESANSLPNGTAVVFPEKNGNEITMTNAIIVDNFMGFADKLPKKVKLIITQDARVKILSNAERFLCLKAPDVRFTIKQESLSTLEDGDLFMAFDGDKAFFPSRVEWINRRTYGTGDRPNDIVTKVYDVRPIHDNDELTNVLTTSETQNILDASIRVPLCTLDSAKFWELPYGDFISKKSKEMAMDEFKLSSLMGKGSICINYHKLQIDNNPYPINSSDNGTYTNKVLCTDPETRVILIKGVINDYIQNPADLDKLACVENYEDVLEKTAAVEKNKIKIMARDRQRGVYDVDVNYEDNASPVFKRFVKSYKSISKDDLKQLLLIVGYGQIETQEIMYKVNNNPQLIYALPKNAKIQALQGAKTKTLAQEKLNNTLKGMVRPKELAGALAATIIGTMIADGLATAPEKAQQMAATIGSYASEGKTLSSVFEKIAQEQKSNAVLDVARMMSLSSYFTEKVASTLTESHVYPRIYESAKDILENRFVLEKMAYDLMATKVMQYKHRNEVINPNYIQSAVAQLDNLHKVAYAVCSVKYDVNEIMEKEAKVDFSKFSPARLGKIMKKVSDKTGVPTGTIAKVLAVGGGVGTGIMIAGATNKKASEIVIEETEKEAGVAGTAAAVGIGANVYGGLRAAKNMHKYKNVGSGTAIGALTGTLVAGQPGLGAWAGSAVAKKKEIARITKRNKTIAGVGLGTGIAGAAALQAKKMSDDKKKSNFELNKEASALAGALAGGLYGAGSSYQKAVDQVKEVDPMAMPSDYGADAGGKAIAGAAAGIAVGALGGAGIKGIKTKLAARKLAKVAPAAETAAQTVSRLASEELDFLLKEAEMNVPTEAEKKKENNVAVNEETGLRDIACEICGYKGQPDERGFCPECGTLGGVKPQNMEHNEERLEPSHDYGGDISQESENSFNI